MIELIVFPDAEAVMVEHLPARVGVPVTTKVPASRPDSFLRVQRTGGSRRDRVTDRPMLTFEAWAPTETAAQDLAALAHGHLYLLADEQVGPVRACRDVGGPVSSPDPESDTPRYVFTVLVDMRGGTA